MANLRTHLALVPIAILAAQACTPPPSEPRDLSVDPPRVVSGVVKLLDKPTAAGNARIEVTVMRDEVLPALLSVHLESGEAILRDDGEAGDAKAGDRVYSAIVPLDVAALKRSQERLRGLQKRHGKLAMPVYRGRQLVARLPLTDEFFRPFRPGSELPIDGWGFAEAVSAERSLLIRHPSVVEDPARTYDPCTKSGTPMGKWTFGFLMSQIANQPYTGISPAQFVRNWIELSRTNQPVNGWVVPPFSVTWDPILEVWPKLPDGTLDLAGAPFRLLAIVNRVDLRDNTVYGGSNAGEARFVFGFQRCGETNPLVALSPKNTVIFEYGVQRPACIPLKSWAQQWQALGGLPLGSAVYNAALEAITDQFSLANAAPMKPNRSALNQLRNNGGSSISFWDMREFRLPGKGPVATHFALSTVKQTPDTRVIGAGYPNPNALVDYVNTNAGPILADAHVVPNTFAGQPFLGGQADGAPFPFGWDRPNMTNRQARHKFALQTCNGCHLFETGTTGGATSEFFHIEPAVTGAEARLSGFMTGIDVPDHFDGTPTRHFDELERRAADLDNLANSLCIAFFDPIERFKGRLWKGRIPSKMPH